MLYDWIIASGSMGKACNGVVIKVVVWLLIILLDYFAVLFASAIFKGVIYIFY